MEIFDSLLSKTEFHQREMHSKRDPLYIIQMVSTIPNSSRLKTSAKALYLFKHLLWKHGLLNNAYWTDTGGTYLHVKY